jgi:hypothetical protein
LGEGKQRVQTYFLKMDDKVKLFNYKGKDINLGRKGNKYYIGIRGSNGVDIWFESVNYNSLQSAMTSGREYARIVIDRMLLSQKEDIHYVNQ